MQAWSNANLSRLAEKIRSPLVFAHVRATTMPGAREFRLLSCPILPPIDATAPYRHSERERLSSLELW